MEQLNEKDLRQALESKDKNVVIDFALRYKWERDYLEKALDILASMFVRETTFGQEDKEEMRRKKKHILAVAKEVAGYIINRSFENEEEE